MNTYETLIAIGMALWIVLALGMLVALLYGIGLLRRVREPLGRISGAVEHLNDRLEPVLGHVERASESASEIAHRLSRDADDVGRALRHAGESTERMVELIEDRVADVAALLEVVQEEAEETFLSTASILRTLRGTRRRRKKKPPPRRISRALDRVSRGR